MLIIIIYIIIFLLFLSSLNSIIFNKEYFNCHHTTIRSDIGLEGQSLIKKVENYVLNVS